MTGILPIPKYSSGPSLNMFSEHTMGNANISRFSTSFEFTESDSDRKARIVECGPESAN